jgi:hypothetical protein
MPPILPDGRSVLGDAGAHGAAGEPPHAARQMAPNLGDIPRGLGFRQQAVQLVEDLEKLIE